MATLVIIQLISNYLIEKFDGIEIGRFYFLIQIFGLTFLMISTTAITKWNLSREIISRDFELQINNDQVAAVALSHQTAQKLRDLAQLLHGTVQTRLTTSILKIKKPNKTATMLRSIWRCLKPSRCYKHRCQLTKSQAHLASK